MNLTKSDILSLPHDDALGFDGLKNFKINGISIDSRTVKTGELFVAIRGNQFDGHNFVSKAIEQGASGIVVERRWAEANTPMMVSIHIPRMIVENTIHALGHLATIYRRKFSIPFIAVGGSNGKTTTKEMLNAVLSQQYRVLCTEGNLNNHIGVPQTLFRLEKKHKVAVVEIGTNHPGEIAYLCSVLEPTHGIVTNIGQEHLEYFKSIEGVAKEEGDLFGWLAKHKGVSFVNADDKHLVRVAKKGKKIIKYGFSARSVSLKGKVESFNADAQALLQVKPAAKKAFAITVGAPGKHNAQNALAATAVGLALKVPQKNIQKALNSFQPVGKRMQIQRAGKIIILNDTYNANPESTLAALATLHEMRAEGKKIAVLADMLELGPQSRVFHQHIGSSLRQYNVHGLLTFGILAKHIHENASVNMKAHFEQKAMLIEYLLKTLEDGDTVLIKGSRGMKMDEIATALMERFSQKAET